MRILTILTLAVFVLNTSPALAALNNGSPSGTLNACSTGIAAGASAVPLRPSIRLPSMKWVCVQSTHLEQIRLALMAPRYPPWTNLPAVRLSPTPLVTQ